MRPTLSRGRRKRSPTPHQIIAYVPRALPGEDGRTFLTRVAREECERRLKEPEAVTLFLILAQYEDALDQLAVSRGRARAAIKRRLTTLTKAAKAARLAARVP